MLAYLAVALAASDLRMASHMREDPSLGAAVLPSGQIELTTTLSAGEDPAPAPPPAPPPPPPATPPPTPEGLSDAEAYIRNMDGDRFLPTPRPTPPPTPNSLLELEEDYPTLHHASKPTPTLDDADNYTERKHAELLYNQSHAEELDAKVAASLPPLPLEVQELKQEAEDEAKQLENLTLAEAAGAVMEVMVGEPMRLLSDMESFLFELKNAVVGPPLQQQIMRADGTPGPLVADEFAAGNAALKEAMALQATMAAQSQGKGLKTLQQVEITKPTGETEYVVSVNGIMEYRPPTAHGAVRVVSVLLLLASAIVLGIGWRYGSAPGMYPYVEDCRL